MKHDSHPPHPIRLRGPWQSRQKSVSPPQIVEFNRHFNRPTGLTGRERVDLVFEQFRAVGQVRLNDVLIGAIDDSGALLRADITAQLRPRNLITIDLEWIAEEKLTADSAHFGEVRLEIFTQSD